MLGGTQARRPKAKAENEAQGEAKETNLSQGEAEASTQRQQGANTEEWPVLREPGSSLEEAEVSLKQEIRSPRVHLGKMVALGQGRTPEQQGPGWRFP